MQYSPSTDTRSLRARLRVMLIVASLASAVWMPCSAFTSSLGVLSPSVAYAASAGSLPTSSATSAAVASEGTTFWQWEKMAGRERILITLALPSANPLEITRTGLNVLQISTPQSVQGLNLQGQDPDVQSLVGNIHATDKGLELELTTSGFGFLATQVNAEQIIIDVFSDPLGARWQADGRLAPLGTPAQEFTVAPPQEIATNVQNANAPLIQPATFEVATSEQPVLTQVAPGADAIKTVQLVQAPDQVSATVPAAVSAAVSATVPAIDGKTQEMPPLQLLAAAQPDTVAKGQAIPKPDALPVQQKTESSSEADKAPAKESGKESGDKSGEELGKESAKDLSADAKAPNSAATSVQPNSDSSEKNSKDAADDADKESTEEQTEQKAETAEQGDAKVDASTEAAQSAPKTLPLPVKQAENSTQELDEKAQGGEQEKISRGTVISPQEVQAPINLSGPEYWPAETGIATKLDGSTTSGTVSSSDATSGSVSSSGADTSASSAVSPTTSPTTPSGEGTPSEGSPTSTAESAQQQPTEVVQSIDPATKPVDPDAPVEEPRPVIYQDEEGNEVPAPPVLEDVYAEAMKLIQEAKYQDALPLLELLLTMPELKADQREQVLYHRSDAVEAIYTGKPFEGYEDIITATNEAMNANLRSTRVPDALHRLGMANLNVGNLAEAEGYFRALRRRYPYDMHVPVDFHLLGKAKMEKGLFVEAEKIFRDILQEYPDSPAVKDGTIALVQALVGQKKFDEALVYADFADKRWARYYIDDPEYLLTLADIDYNLGKKEAALEKYWLLYNLRPTHEDAPNILTSIGDLYFELRQPEPALEVFADVLVRFPESDAGALALLRLSEKGLYDSPLNMAAMFGVFEDPGKPLPQVTYQDLYKERPTDARSITSLLKYALWQLWDKQYAESMGTASDFIDLYPENVDVELARDVIMRGFMADLKNSLIEENYGRILTLWNGFPLVRERYGEIDPDLRNALARGYLERGDDAKAMELFAQFLQTPKHPKYSDPTFALYFNKYLETGNWNAMLDLGELVKDWKMTKAMRGQLDYAMALSAENLGLRERSLKLWKQLAADTEIPKYQRAYATYFLAKDAEERKDIKDAYAYNLKTLQFFDELKQERSDRADEGRRKEAMGALMDITEVANRIPEALEWVERYNQFVDANSPEYPGLRFREARLYRKLGNAEKAKQLLELIATGYADSPFAAAARTELATFEVSRDLQNFIPQNR